MNKVKLFVMDVDGVLTDSSIYIGQKGEIMKRFNVKDGVGIKLLHENKIKTAIITSRKSDIVKNRSKELNINYVFQGVKNKFRALKNLSNKLKIPFSNIAYIGDDLHDLQILKEVGLPICPNDAVKEVKKASKIITKKDGGNGCVREICEFIIK